MTPADVDVAQSYENFTGGVVMSLIEHGFCSYETANEVLTYENLIAPGGRLPLNTSGGNLAECYMHGLGLVIEAARQIRGDSTNQVPDAKVSFANAGADGRGRLRRHLRHRGGAGLMARRSVRACPTGCPLPVPTGDGLDARYWEGTRSHELWVQRCAACRHLAVGARVDLPRLPPLRARLGAGGAGGRHLLLGAAVAPGPPGARRRLPLRGPAGRAAPRRRRPHGRQPRRRPAAALRDRRPGAKPCSRTTTRPRCPTPWSTGSRPAEPDRYASAAEHPCQRVRPCSMFERYE